MNDIYVDIRGTELEELFDTDLITVEALVEKIIDAKCEIAILNEKIEELEEYKEQYCEKYEFN